MKFDRPVDVADAIVTQPFLAFGVTDGGSADVVGKPSRGGSVGASDGFGAK